MGKTAKLFISVVSAATLTLYACKKKDDSPASSLANSITATIDGQPFASSGDLNVYNAHYSYIHGERKSPFQTICFIFSDTNAYKKGTYDIGNYAHNVGVLDTVIGTSYQSISGKINITQIDTGTVNGLHGIFKNLEATFNFNTISYDGKSQNFTNGKIVYHK